MTWVGFLAVFFCFVSYWGSWLQWRAAKQLTPANIRKAFRFGVLLGVALTTVVLLGILTIGTGHL